MNILFLTIGRFASIEAHSIYADLLRCFRDHGHEIYTITPYEKKTGKKTELVHEKGAHILHIETGNVTGANNLISKGFAQVSLEPTFIKAIKKYFSDVKFDLVMYSTPPITFSKAVEFVKKRDGAKSYLLLKDIFPQNAVDLGMMRQGGLLHRYFRAKEKRLYALSDRIGCMSPANVAYVLKHNPQIAPERVEVCPNSIEPRDLRLSAEDKAVMRDKYGLPQDKRIFVYGGNLGKPQDVPFIIRCLQECKNVSEAFFLIVGSGTDYPKLQAYVEKEKPQHVKLLPSLPREAYDTMIAACDVGLIFLDHRFTIPNFPSRLLGYMQAKIPVLAVTDPNTDIGKVIVDGGFGWWCESNDPGTFKKTAVQICKETTQKMGFVGYGYLLAHFTATMEYDTIMSRFGSNSAL